MSKTKVSSRGQTVIPRAIRETYGIRAGNRVEWLARDAETIVLRKVTAKPATNWSQWAESLRGAGKEIWDNVDPVAYTHSAWHAKDR